MSAVGTLGKVEEFDSSKEEWTQYVERLGHFFTANGITDAGKKRAVFLSIIGAATYKILRNLVSPVKPGDKSYAQLVDALSKHYKPIPSEIIERFKFHNRFRRAGESVGTYVAELRCLSEYCNFGGTLEVMIRDRLVCGINDSTIQKRLLAEPGLTYDKAVELSLSMEMAAKNLKELKVKSEPSGDANFNPTQQDVHRLTSQTATGSTVTCYRCGKRGHTVLKCRVNKSVVCHHCGKSGHLQKACRSKQKGTQLGTGKCKARTVCQVQGEQEQSDSGDSTLFHVKASNISKAPPIRVKIKVDDCIIPMEVDTGASMSLLSLATFQGLWPGRSLSPTDVRLQSYSKELIPVVGCCYVNIVYNGQTTSKIPLVIVEGSGPSLLGRDWLSLIKLDWKQICQVYTHSLQSLLERYSNVFQEGLGTLKGFEAKIYVDPEATPRFHRARSVPYALRDKVEQELKRLQDEGILEPVEISEWAAPIVPVLKRDKNSVRICGDFRLTVNPVSKLDKYPIPRVEDLFASLRKGQYFTKIDLSQAYTQLPLEEESKRFVVINTQRGLFRYTRLPFGIASAPGIFQRVIESLLQGINGVVAYLDDILVTGSTETEHLTALEEVLSRLE